MPNRFVILNSDAWAYGFTQEYVSADPMCSLFTKQQDKAMKFHDSKSAHAALHYLPRNYEYRVEEINAEAN